MLYGRLVVSVYLVRRKEMGEMPYDKDRVWDKAKQIRGRNPNVHRQDPYGNQIYKPSYGKDSPQGWEVDHIKPKSRGGSDNLRNLQAMKTSVNRSKGNSTQKRSRHYR